MGIRYYWRLIRGKTEALNPAKIDLPHIWAVIQSWVRSILPVPEHIKQQIAWRRYQVHSKSPECLRKGSCIQCGCEIEGKLMADMGCENEPFCYPDMMTKKGWKEYQKYHQFSVYRDKEKTNKI